MTQITLVTGGAGFVGKHLVRKLRALNERVRVFDLAPSAHEDDVKGSITDPDAVMAAMEGVDTVFHLAGNAQLWSRDPSVFDAVNRQGTENVLRAARVKNVRRLVHCSSLTTLVGKSTPVGRSHADETVKLAPDDMLGPYPRSKREAEIAVEKAVEAGLDAVIALPTEPLGPGDESLTPPTRMILDFVNGRTPAYIDCLLNFVPVESLADGLIAARDSGGSGERYLLGGDNLTMQDLLVIIGDLSVRPMPKTKMPYWVALLAGALDTKLVAAITGRPPKAPLTGVRLAGRQVSFSSLKAKRELDWQAAPAVPALAAMLDWARGEGLI